MDSFAQIPACGSDASKTRPLWSVLIPCHNCAVFLSEALRSVLDQDPGPDRMEILVLDDCSDKDDPKAVVDELGKGRVLFFSQSVNVGKVRNYEAGLLASQGHLIHQLHGDDRVMPGFYKAMEEAFRTTPEAGAFFCESDYIDENGRVTGRTGQEMEKTGILKNWLPRIATAQLIQTPSMVVRREVYETLGGFDRRLDCSEDWEMWIRISNRFPVGFCVEAKAQYRTSADNNSSRSILSGRRGRMQRKMFDIVDAYLTPEIVKKINNARAKEQALFFAAQIPKVIHLRGFFGWWKLCLEVLKFSMNLSVMRRLASLSIRGFFATK